MVSTQCLEMNLSDLVMLALGPSALVLTSLDQTDSFSRHSADTMHSAPLWVMTPANDDDDDDYPKLFFKSAKNRVCCNWRLILVMMMMMIQKVSWNWLKIEFLVIDDLYFHVIQ